jgi:outer membrane receptor protein involved in Fe transport
MLYHIPRFSTFDLTIRGEIQNLLNRFYFAEGQANAFYPAAERNFLIGLSVHL